MNILDRSLLAIDKFQQKHHIIAFPYALIKKVGEDDAGFQAALITYYGFLSLFPLLLVATSVIGILSLGNAAIEARVMESVGNYFPVVGEQLSQNIRASSKSGIALVAGLIVTFYGARGGADAFRSALNHVWHVPKKHRAGFPKSLLHSLSITLCGGLGLMLAAILSAYAAGLGKSVVFKVLSTLASFVILIPTFYFMYWISLPRDYVAKRDNLRGAVASSFGIVVVQALGGYVVTSQLKTLSPLYGTFALVLGLLFWIYLQSLIVVYAVEFSIITKYNLWPRSLTGKMPTKADRSDKLV